MGSITEHVPPWPLPSAQRMRSLALLQRGPCPGKAEQCFVPRNEQDPSSPTTPCRAPPGKYSNNLER